MHWFCISTHSLLLRSLLCFHLVVLVTWLVILADSIWVQLRWRSSYIKFCFTHCCVLIGVDASFVTLKKRANYDAKIVSNGKINSAKSCVQSKLQLLQKTILLFVYIRDPFYNRTSCSLQMSVKIWCLVTKPSIVNDFVSNNLNQKMCQRLLIGEHVW